MGLLEHVDANIRERHLLKRGDKILVAVSGGVDSMVLLHVLAQLAPTRCWKLVLAHVNHGWRGRAAAADARFVERTARQLTWPSVIVSFSAPRQARASGQSIEMTARRYRHQFLADIATRQDCQAIALAHHADDQVEWFFLRLFRGSGPRSLAGMSWQNPSPACPGVKLVRPLLDCKKSDIRQYARAHRISFREDATNQCRDILRNRIRLELLPKLKTQYQPGLDRVLLRTMDIVQAEHQWLDTLLRTEVARHRDRPFYRWPVALQRRHLQAQLERLETPWSFDLIESLRTQPGLPITIGPDLRLACDEQGKIRMVAPHSIDFSPDERTVLLAGHAGQITFGGRLFLWAIRKRAPRVLPAASRGVEWFDAARVGRQIILRHWRPGDRFHPLGLSRRTKLQDLFTNLKVPAADRRTRVVACDLQGLIWWVEGCRMSELHKVTPATRRFFQWRWRVLPAR